MLKDKLYFELQDRFKWEATKHLFYPFLFLQTMRWLFKIPQDFSSDFFVVPLMLFCLVFVGETFMLVLFFSPLKVMLSSDDPGMWPLFFES